MRWGAPAPCGLVRLVFPHQSGPQFAQYQPLGSTEGGNLGSGVSQDEKSGAEQQHPEQSGSTALLGIAGLQKQPQPWL